MTTRLTDSALYGHLWGTPEVRAIVDERGRIQTWLDVLVALAEAQAELNLVPTDAARAIRAHAETDRLDLALIAERTRATGHSMLGLIDGLHQALPPDAAEHVYYGATVQDVTDTATALTIARVGAILWRDLRELEASALELAERHRDTVMVGRTHGQAGSPITFGWKAAGWADELRRDLDRLREGAPRWLVGQLGGAVGTGAFFGEVGLELRKRFCERVGLHDPTMSWLASRDRIAEFATTAALIAGTTGRIGNEVYALQRSEIGELREPAPPEAVSSITMPHKRNPELSEHLVTLARAVQAQAALLLGSAVHEHERDGRSWKLEWPALPEVCLLTAAATGAARHVLDGLEVDVVRMRHNVSERREEFTSERALATLAPRIGKHRAQAQLQQVLAAARRRGLAVHDALRDDPGMRQHLPEDELRALFDAVPDVGSAPRMVDAVVARGRVARAKEPGRWP